MNLEQYDQRDGRKVWLDDSEVDLLLSAARENDREHEIAIGLGARCGLRTHEMLQVRPKDIVDTTSGTMLRVRHGKGDKYRETPIPRELAALIRGYADASDSPVLSISQTRSIQKWVSRAAAQCRAETGDEGWQYLTPHDLRGTWATNLDGSDVNPLVVCDWGGWNSLETFLEHYRGVHSPQVQKQEREKVDWL